MIRTIRKNKNYTFCFSRTNIDLKLLTIVIFFVALTGCATIPRELKGLGAEFLKKCPKNFERHEDLPGIIFASVESDMAVDTLYILITNTESGSKFLMTLKPKRFGLPRKEFFNDYRYSAKVYGYTIKPGKYSFNKLYAFSTVIITKNGIQSTVTDFREYNYEKEFQVLPNNIIYAGRFIIVDPRTKGKGYFGHMGVMMCATLKVLFTNSIMPKDVEINIINKLEEDYALFNKKTKSLQFDQVVSIL